MCLMCEGASLDEVRFSILGTIERDGWAVVAVGSPSGGDLPWAYTIGLSAGFDHPELVITGSVGCGPDILDHLGAAVRVGERFRPGGPEIEVHGLRLRIGEVHPNEWTSGRFAAWVDFYGALGPPGPEPVAVQVLWPDGLGRFPGQPGFDTGCPSEDGCQPLLDSPRAGPSIQRFTRAERRRQARSARRPPGRPTRSE